MADKEEGAATTNQRQGQNQPIKSAATTEPRTSRATTTTFTYKLVKL